MRATVLVSTDIIWLLLSTSLRHVLWLDPAPQEVFVLLSWAFILSPPPQSGFPANHSLHKPQTLEQNLAMGIPGKHLNIHSGTLCKANLKDLTQWILDEHKLLEDTHFPDAMILTRNIRAFQDLILKARYIPS